MSCQELTEGVRDALFLKCYQLILNCFIVIGEADKCSLDTLTAVKAGKLLITEGTGQLAGGRKLKKITESPVLMVPTGVPFSVITVGSMNSSVLPSS